MNPVDTLLNTLESNNLEAFIQSWGQYRQELSDEEVQNLIACIAFDYYKDKRFSYFKKIFDLILTRKVSLNFQFEHGPPTLLCIVIHYESRPLLDYFLKAGADINFVGDHCAFDSPEDLSKNIGILDLDRYETVLDYAERRLYDLLRFQYHYKVPEKSEEIDLALIQKNEKITVSKFEYYDLIDQAEYLRSIIRLDKLVSDIQSLGGKNSSECLHKRN